MNKYLNLYIFTYKIYKHTNLYIYIYIYSYKKNKKIYITFM